MKHFLTILLIVGAACGCDVPQASFSYRQETNDLIREARSVVRDSVSEHFGKPGEMQLWARLPLAFGGVAGTVKGVGEGDPLDSLVVSFAAPDAMIRFDRNLDGALTMEEFPADIQAALNKKRGSKTAFERADADENKKLTADELSRVRIDNDEFSAELVSPFDGENAQQLAGRYLHFTTPYDTVGTKKVEQQRIRLKIKSYDPKTETVTFTSGRFAEAPAVGEKVIADLGHALKDGRKLYMHHCMHCHGVTGDGGGPTAEFLNPRPRDYRQGKFKFASTGNLDRPQRKDLERIVELGIPGTYMPSFALLKQDEVNDIVEYVRWLSMRGEFEGKLISQLAPFSRKALDERAAGSESSRSEIMSKAQDDLKDELEYLHEWEDTAGDDIALDWSNAEKLSSVILPTIKRTEDSEASRARGRQLFLAGNCHNCHGSAGLGNGSQTVMYNKNDLTGKPNPGPGLYDVWGNPIQPRNLTSGMYRGGRRPLDVYRRVREGIPGTPMPRYPNLPDTELRDRQIWDIVNYVMSLPYQKGNAPRRASEASPHHAEVAASTKQDGVDSANAGSE